MRCGRKGRLTDFDELIVCVTPEKAVREEGDDRVDGRHVQDADATGYISMVEYLY